MSRSEYEKGVCQCRSCNKMFFKTDIIHNVVRGRIECQCPHCNSNKFGLVNYPIDEFELIYKSKTFFNPVRKSGGKKLTSPKLKEV